MADPLTLLRDFNLRKQLGHVQLIDGRINFGDKYSFAKGAFVAYRNSRDQDFYTLEAALFLLQNRALSQAEFIKLASNNGVLRPVSIVDRKKLLDFLDGLGELQLESVPIVSTSAADEDGLYPEAKRPRLEADDDTQMSRLLAQERQLRTRNTMLLAPNRNFQRVLELLQRAMEARKRERQERALSSKPAAASKQQQHHAPTVTQKPATRPSVPMSGGLPIKASGRFERDDTQAQLQEMAGAAVGSFGTHISLYGYKPGGNNPTSTSTSVPPPPPPPASTSASQPSGSSRQPSSGGSSGKPAYVSTRPGSSSGGHHKPAAPAAAAAGAAAAAAAAKKGGGGGGVPIIIVPSGMTAMLNMYNAQQFLQDAQFETADAAMKRGQAKQTLLVLNRTVGREKPVKYHVIDKAPPKDSKDWERVVAVVAQGVKWQFKDFPFKGAAEGDMAETFHKVCGFYFHWADETKVTEPVASWNVKRLGIHRELRNADSSIVRSLFAHLDQFLLSKRCALTY